MAEGTAAPAHEPGSGTEPKIDGPHDQTPKEAIIDALMELAGERSWQDISISDVAARANVSLATFREFFPSKGAVLAAFSRKIDKAVLAAASDELIGEPAKDRLFDVLMRRLDAMAPYRLGLESIAEWAQRDPMAFAAINRETVNSMRFMLEAAGIDSEGPVGALKLQGLALSWSRILGTWFHDDDPGLADTMAALDRELSRGGRIVARAEDVNRLVSPLFSIARAVFENRLGRRQRKNRRDETDDPAAAI